jgi:hypothetical protein
MYVLNSYGNCTTDLKGSGTRTCDLGSYGDVIGIALFAKGSKILLDSELTTSLQDWKNRIKALTLFPYLGIYNFEQSTPENDRSTSNTGVMSDIRKGKPQFTFSFDKGGCFHKSLYNKDGSGRWDLGILFDKGLLLANKLDGKVGGFDMGMFSVETFKLLSGTDPQQSSAMVQLLDAVEFNQYHEFFTWESLGANFSKVNGVVDTNVSIVGAAEDVATLTVRVVSSCNTDDPVFGLDDEALWDLGGTSAVTITSVAFNTSTNNYVFTLSGPLVVGTTVAPFLTDGTYDVVEDVAGTMYKGGVAAPATVTAEES